MYFTFPACASECAQCTGATATACTVCKKGFYIDGSTCKGNQTLLFYMMKLLLFYNFMKGCNYKSNSGVNLLSPNHTSNIT